MANYAYSGGEEKNRLEQKDIPVIKMMKGMIVKRLNYLN